MKHGAGKRWAANVLALSLVIAVATATNAHASESPGGKPVNSTDSDIPYNSNPSMWNTQNLLDATGASITSFADSHDPNFYALANDVPAATIYIYRVGGTPAEGSALASGYTKLASSGVHIAFRNSSVTNVQANAIFKYFGGAHASLRAKGYRIGRVRFDLKTTRLIVGYSRPASTTTANKNTTLAPLTGSTVLAISSPQVVNGRLEDSATASSLTSIVNAALYKEEPPSIPFDRVSDYPPYFGGSRVHGPTGAMANNQVSPQGFTVCSSGFAVRSKINGSDYLTVPYHCYKPASPAFFTQWTTSGNKTLGNVTATEVANDTAFIKTGSSSAPYIFNGPFEDNLSGINVAGSSAIIRGDSYCASGANSGNRCGGIVNSTRETDEFQNLYTGQDYSVYVYEIVSNTYTQYAAQGDSGGPVYAAQSGTTVIAKGTIVGGAGEGLATCQDAEPDPEHPIICTTGALVTPAQDLANSSHQVTFSW